MEPTPEMLEVFRAEPELDESAQIYVRAWHELHSERPVGMAGAGLIPWSSVVAWCEFRGFDTEATTLVVEVIRDLDHRRAEREASKGA